MKEFASQGHFETSTSCLPLRRFQVFCARTRWRYAAKFLFYHPASTRSKYRRKWRRFGSREVPAGVLSCRPATSNIEMETSRKFIFNANQVVNENFVTARIDHRFSEKDSLFGHIPVRQDALYLARFIWKRRAWIAHSRQIPPPPCEMNA